MERDRKLDLIQRSLGLKHKLRVHDSMKNPDTHEDMAANMLAKWEFEDEIAAIDDVLAEARKKSVQEKRANLLKEGVQKKKKKT